MIVWMVIAVSLGFALLGLKKGLFVMWTVLFNLLFAVFISVLSTRTLLSYSPQYERHGYYAAFVIFLLFILIFVPLQVFAWFYFLRHRGDYFPKILNHVGGFLIGGVCGYIITTLLILVLCVMPCSIQGKVNWLSTREKMQTLAVPAVCKACNFLAWYSIECLDGDAEKAVGELLHITDPPKEDPVLYYVPKEKSSMTSPEQLPDNQN